MQKQDALGLSYSAPANTPIARFDEIMESYLQFRPDTIAKLNSLLDANATWPMALILKGYLLKMGSDPRFAPAIKICQDSLTTLALNHREERHVTAFNHWLNDDINAALNQFEQILQAYPTDLIALKAAHNLHFYQGDATSMHESIARVLPAWPEQHNWRSFVLGMYSFGLEESGQYQLAEATGKEAIALNPYDLWAAHAVTHVYHMQNQWLDGVDWLNELIPVWTETNNFVYHLHWHKAVLYLSNGDAEAALAIYDETLTAPLQDDLYLDVCNAASLLWRLQMQGLDVKDRWQTLQSWRHRASDDELIFITLHYLMAPAVLKDQATIARSLDTIRAWSERTGQQAAICKEVGLTTAEALVDIGQNKTVSGVDKLKRVKDRLYTIGGSHAQRQLFSDLIHHYSRNT